MQELTKRPTTPSILLTHLESTMKQFQSLMAVMLIFIEIASPIPFYGWQVWPISPAEAVLYSPETNIPRTGELALRRAIPANPNMKTIQVTYFCLASIFWFSQTHAVSPFLFV